MLKAPPVGGGAPVDGLQFAVGLAGIYPGRTTGGIRPLDAGGAEIASPNQESPANQASTSAIATGKGGNLGKAATKSSPDQKNEKGNTADSKAKGRKEERKGDGNKGKNLSNKEKVVAVNNSSAANESKKPNPTQAWRVVGPKPSEALNSEMEMDQRMDSKLGPEPITMETNGPNQDIHKAMEPATLSSNTLLPSPPLNDAVVDNASIRKHFSKRQRGVSSQSTKKRTVHLQVVKKGQGSSSTTKNGKRGFQKKNRNPMSREVAEELFPQSQQHPMVESKEKNSDEANDLMSASSTVPDIEQEKMVEITGTQEVGGTVNSHGT
ncbi:unnamed protein product [Linum trigynum]|uniref:Uncharacterized protein n=1 Tax=Linum trigynum TaxID=586398 RepID=A0AAV2FAW5_9ROSI